MFKILWLIVQTIVMIFAGVAGIVTLIMTWFNKYEPFVDGPDPLTLLLAAMVIWLYLEKDYNK